MESFILQGDKNIRYHPLQSNEDESTTGVYNKNCQGNSSKFSFRRYLSWSRLWTALDMPSDYKNVSNENIGIASKGIRNANVKYGVLGCLCFLMMSISALLFYLSLKNSFGTAEDVSKQDEQLNLQVQDPSVSFSSSEGEDLLMKNWEKYANEFFTFDGLGTRAVYTSPTSTLTCEQPGLITIIINSTTEQNWKDFKADKACSELLIIEHLELYGIFSYEDLQHILSEIPNIASLKLFSLSIKPNDSPTPYVQEKIVFPILTSLSIIEATGEAGQAVFGWIDEIVEMPFLSEILIMKSNIAVTPVNSILKKSEDLKSLFLIGNSIACKDFTSCPSFTIEMTNLIELVLINGDDQQNDYWGLFINSMLLKVKNNKSLRILETNIPTNALVLEILIDSELRVENRQVYEISFRLPSLNSSSVKEFAKHQIAAFEKYYTRKCSKANVGENDSPIIKSSQWVNLCQDSQHNIMYGFNKAKFIQDSHLTIFIRRAQTGNVVCYDDFSAKESGSINDGDFSCQNHF